MAQERRVSVQQLQLQRRSTTSTAWQARWAGVSAIATVLLLITSFAAERVVAQRDDLAAQYDRVSGELVEARGAQPRVVTDADGGQYLTYDGHLYGIADPGQVSDPVEGPIVQTDFVSDPLDWMSAWSRWGMLISGIFAAIVGAMVVFWARRRGGRDAQSSSDPVGRLP